MKVKGVTNECLSLVKRTGGKPSGPEEALAFILLMARKTSGFVTVTSHSHLSSSTREWKGGVATLSNTNTGKVSVKHICFGIIIKHNSITIHYAVNTNPA